MDKDFKIFAAPLQGYTESPWRIAHNAVFGGVDAYYTPFVRMEKGGLRNKDKRDVTPVTDSYMHKLYDSSIYKESVSSIHIVPQIIASEVDEFRFLADYIVSLGYKEIDLNMGCPFPLIVNRGKGSGMLPHTDRIAAVLDSMARDYSDIIFSVKMRLGMDSAEDWRSVLPLLNDSCVSRITLHSRIGKQQYKGNVDMDSFRSFYEECRKSLVYNGDLKNVEGIRKIQEDFPLLEGVMLGRGLLADGSMASAFKSGVPLTEVELYRKTKEMHTMMFRYYSAAIEGGESQLLQKMKTLWEYWLLDMDKKKRKAILKANRLDLYLRAVDSI